MKECENLEVEVEINGYPFMVKFVKKTEIEGSDGITYHNDRVIKIRDDLDEIATTLILRHELVHAFLGTQGRVFQRKFNVEEVCEFISYCSPVIESVIEEVRRKL